MRFTLEDYQVAATEGVLTGIARARRDYGSPPAIGLAPASGRHSALPRTVGGAPARGRAAPAAAILLA